MKRTIILLIIAAALIVAAFTNPNEEAHRKAMNGVLDKYVKHYVEVKMEKTGKTIGSFSGDVAATLAKPAVAAFVNKNVSRTNCYFFSLTKLKAEGKENVVGIGAFGYVYVTGLLNKELDKHFGLDKAQ